MTLIDIVADPGIPQDECLFGDGLRVQNIREERNGTRYRVRGCRHVRRHIAAVLARIVKVVGRAGIERDLDIATSRAALVDQFTTMAWRDFLIGGALEHPDRRIGNETAVKLTLQSTSWIKH